jgi:hypothetical protein
MENNEKFSIVISAFKSYLETVKHQFPKTLIDLHLKKYEIKIGKYHDFITFYIYPQYSPNYFNAGDINNIVEMVYKFGNFNKYFGMEKNLEFYFIFTSSK